MKPFNSPINLLVYIRGKILRKLLSLLIVLLVSFQPLHNYTIINLASAEDNGFHLLHAEMCGSTYSNSLSHTKKISNLLDKINSAVLSDMKEDCVCCNSIDTSSNVVTLNIDFTDIQLPNEQLIQKHFYDSFVNTIGQHKSYSRAPPVI